MLIAYWIVLGQGRQHAFIEKPNLHFVHMHKVSLRDVVDLKSRGCRLLKRPNTGDERCVVHWCCTVAAAAVAPLLYCADALEVQS